MKRRAETRISEAEAGRELLPWLVERFTYLDDSGWRRMIEEGRLRLDGQAADAGSILEAGALLRFEAPPLEEPPVDARFRVVHEEEALLVVDKPGDLPCHPGGRYFNHSLWALLRPRWPEARIVTRLDRETSGLVLVALGAAEAARLGALSAEGRIRKDYLALVRGAFPEKLAAAGWLVPDRESRIRKRRRFQPGEAGAKPEPEAEACSTMLRLIGAREVAGFGRLSLVAARLETGRTHQIRATLSSLGFPLLGDLVYGEDEGAFLRFIEEGEKGSTGARVPREGGLGFARQALHAWRLELPRKEGGALILAAPPPEDFRTAMPGIAELLGRAGIGAWPD